MHFGKSLASLATDITAGYGERNDAAVVRTSSLSRLNAATRRTMSSNMADRAAMAADLAAKAKALRSSLKASRREASGVVTAFRAEVRTEQAAAATAMASLLGTFVGDVRAKSKEFRTEARAEQSAAASTMASLLDTFVAGVRTETAAIQAEVQDQFKIARGAWGHVGQAISRPHTATAGARPPAGNGPSVTPRQRPRDVEKASRDDDSSTQSSDKTVRT
jgi:hypothetical protein